jgi:hypothetical protein
MDELESIYKVPFSGSGGFVRPKRIEPAGSNPRRQWNAALQALLNRRKIPAFSTL